MVGAEKRIEIAIGIGMETVTNVDAAVPDYETDLDLACANE
jgi:hypothetical protein